MTAMDRDRERAATVLGEIHNVRGWDEAEEVLGDALAAERARVLAPVLAVAAELEAEGAALQAGPGRSAWLHGQRALDAAARIRLAAQDGERK